MTFVQCQLVSRLDEFDDVVCQLFSVRLLQEVRCVGDDDAMGVGHQLGEERARVADDEVQRAEHQQGGLAPLTTHFPAVTKLIFLPSAADSLWSINALLYLPPPPPPFSKYIKVSVRQVHTFTMIANTLYPLHSTHCTLLNVQYLRPSNYPEPLKFQIYHTADGKDPRGDLFFFF